MAKHGTKVKHGNGTRNPTLHVDGISPPHFGRFVQSVHIKNVGKGQGWDIPPPRSFSSPKHAPVEPLNHAS
jgi:hypothetical protein